MTAVVGHISDGQETELRELVGRFLAWFRRNNLILNVNKLKEMTVDLKKTYLKADFSGQRLQVSSTRLRLEHHTLQKKTTPSTSSSHVTSET